MKNLLTALAVTLFIGGFTSQAQAAVNKCTLNFKADNASLLVIGGMEGTGMMKCEDAYGNTTSGKVAITSGGLSLGLGVCGVKGTMKLVGAGITWNDALSIFAHADLGPVFFGGKSYGVVAAASPFNPNVQVGVSKLKYTAGCLKLASLQLGAIMDWDSYERKIEKRKQDQQYREDYGR